MWNGNLVLQSSLGNTPWPHKNGKGDHPLHSISHDNFWNSNLWLIVDFHRLSMMQKPHFGFSVISISPNGSFCTKWHHPGPHRKPPKKIWNTYKRPCHLNRLPARKPGVILIIGPKKTLHRPKSIAYEDSSTIPPTHSPHLIRRPFPGSRVLNPQHLVFSRAIGVYKVCGVLALLYSGIDQPGAPACPCINAGAVLSGAIRLGGCGNIWLFLGRVHSVHWEKENDEYWIMFWWAAACLHKYIC
jgi:hypothetical protein